MSFMFENLEVYQRAVDLAEKMTALTDLFPTRGHQRLNELGTKLNLSIAVEPDKLQ